MEGTMRPTVVIIMAPPEGGKGTQAQKLEQEGFFSLESSAVIHEQFEKHPDDPVTKEQREKIARGEIVDPPIILAWMKTKMTELLQQGKNLVLSGSPRTRFEMEGLLPILEQLCGRDHVFFFYLSLTEDEALRRARTRLICVAHDHPAPPGYMGTTCPWDGSPLQRRPDGLDDNPDLVRKRHREYIERIKPIAEYIEQHGYPIHTIDGSEDVDRIHTQIDAVLNGSA